MSKTPEEMAEEYVAHNRSYPYDSLNAQDRYMRNSYLVGYKAGCENTQTQLAVGEKTIRELLGKSQWISVKDRLPDVKKTSFSLRKESSCVLIVSYDNVYVAHLCEKWCDRTHFIFCACDCSCRGHDMEQDEWEVDQVTHWMPLPAPPKEEK